MSIAFFSDGHGHVPDAAGAGDVDQQRHEIFVRNGLRAADVEDLAVAGVGGARPKERIRGIVDVDEIANLGAVAEDLDLVPFQRQADEPADESLAIVPDQLARTVHVGQAQRARPHLEDVVVQQVVVLAGRLVDPVDVDRAHEMIFGDRQGVGLAVHLARAREHDLDARVELPARLEDRQLAAAVDVEIRVRILHAVDVAHLAGEIEDDLAIAHQVVHRAFLAHVGDVHPDLVGDAVDVEEVRAGVGNERVHQQHIGAELDQPAGDVAADEAEAARDHHAPAAVELQIRRVTSTRVRSPAGADGLGRPPVCLPHDEREPELHHVHGRAEHAREVEELRMAVRAMVVVNGDLDDRETGVLDLLHHLEADDAAVFLQSHGVEDRAPHKPEVAVDVAHVQPEQRLDDVMVDPADDDAVPADPSG